MKLSDVPHYVLDGRIAEARYVNSNGFATAVVAVVGSNQGEIRDWAAYWGGCDLTRKEDDCLRWVAENGAKMSYEDAMHFFPYLPGVLYRG